MSIIDTLITDRTSADVEHAKALKRKVLSGSALTPDEQTEYFAGLKGAYTHYIDLNRIGQACAYLYNLFASMGYTVPGYVAPKADWVQTDVLTKPEADKYIPAVNALKAIWSVSGSAPATLKGIDYADANEIERILVDIEETAQRVSSIFLRAGMPWAISGVSYYFIN